MQRRPPTLAPMIGTTLAIVPLRGPGTGKTRLAREGEDGPGLEPSERAVLTSAMLSDVLSAVRDSPIETAVVAAADAAASALATALGVGVVRDPPGSDLNQALRTAVGRIPADAVVIVTADLPCLTGEDLAELVSRDAQVVIGPTADGGTSALLRRPPTVVPTAYGPGSATRHLDIARAAGVTSAVVDRPGFRTDVDTWEDLRGLLSVDVGPATAAMLDRLASRLERTR